DSRGGGPRTAVPPDRARDAGDDQLALTRRRGDRRSTSAGRSGDRGASVAVGVGVVRRGYAAEAGWVRGAAADRVRETGDRRAVGGVLCVGSDSGDRVVGPSRDRTAGRVPDVPVRARGVGSGGAGGDPCASDGRGRWREG